MYSGTLKTSRKGLRTPISHIKFDGMDNQIALNKRYVGIKELAKYLSIPKGSLYVMVCEKRIPYLKIGRRLKFDLKAIDAWLENKRIKELA